MLFVLSLQRAVLGALAALAALAGALTEQQEPENCRSTRKQLPFIDAATSSYSRKD